MNEPEEDHPADISDISDFALGIYNETIVPLLRETAERAWREGFLAGSGRPAFPPDNPYYPSPGAS